jgi:hypothetical protein
VREERMERAPSPAESALLDPDLSQLDEHVGAEVIRAELGFGQREPFVRYVLRDDAPPVAFAGIEPAPGG